MKSFIEKHPFWFSLLFTVVVMQLLGLVVVIVGARILGLPELPVRVVAQAATTIVPLILVWRLGWWEDTGLGSTTQNMYALVIPLVLTFFPLVLYGTTTMESQRVNIFLLAVLFTGISEEVVYRGLFIRAFLPRGRWQAVLIPAVIFGFAHIVNSLAGGMSLGDNLVQIANAFIYGVMLGAVRLRINNIWPLIVIHTLIDLFWVTAGLPDGVITLAEIPLSEYLIEWVPSIIAAFYLMRKPIAATIDGKPVGIMDKPLAAPVVNRQAAG
ncbi:MAG TPA: CPBP family intramembrane glutamic endopeptidase [Anaerolineales bacterium]|nr:CPBP family intramembrane glutamic endopeptidase [Anaerolineales bacterium]